MRRNPNEFKGLNGSLTVDAKVTFPNRTLPRRKGDLDLEALVQLPRGAVAAPSLKVSKARFDGALSDQCGVWHPWSRVEWDAL